MNKFKFDIKKNNLSWENNSFKQCDSDKCSKKGEYRAPKSRILLNDYFYFCLNHIKEYNKSWDFYKGMSVDQIENSMRSDTVWARPSWPLKGNYKNKRIVKKANKKRNPVAKQLRHFKQKVVKNKKIYDRKNYKI